ncbi:Tyrosine kinase specific for activated [Rhizoctonia solani]|uniref:Tyrosine kinase specific for activated n=1 Tax=Rhizoctonia solani TaxID=456999 RepID=A0A8H8P9Q9_9AGAM|nr:Tyrosine kinase specific for activated [Rhizoctonia solani]QRW27755.1 Tyrosine kinase specific for activated [Rhizoctonia solani]
MEDDDAVYGLNKTELEWVTHQPYLKAKGYTLRPRYSPGWVPSWKSNGRNPADCEDSWELPAIKTLDAIKDEDNKHVSIKKSIPSTNDDEAQNELDILRYLSEDDQRDDPHNHGLQLLDHFPIPGSSNGSFLITPFLSDWDSIPFSRFSELTDFLQQILEGLQFLHSRHIAHRDAQIANIMMDATSLYGEPFHPCDSQSSLDGKRRLKVKRRFEAPVRYYFIDFGLSTRFPSLKDRRLVTGVKGREQRAPELLPAVPPPYDPFKLDIFTIGMVFKENIVQKSWIPNTSPFDRQDDRRRSGHPT